MSTTILLKPRPYATYAGAFILLPLLPSPKPLAALPSEIWADIFSFVLGGASGETDIWSIIRVSKGFQATALPLAYRRVRIRTISQLHKFYACLHNTDKKWDSIRRIPHSAPGRWVQSLNLSDTKHVAPEQAFQVDSLLTRLFPLLPTLAHFTMNPSFVMSRRAILSLAQRQGCANIRTLEGITYVPSVIPGEEESMVFLLRCCENLEEIEIARHSLIDPFNLEHPVDRRIFVSTQPLHLPNLRILSILSIYHSPLLHVLLNSELPSLTKLTITPYDDIPDSPVSQLIATHGPNLRSLLLFTPKSWPTRLHPSPSNLLDISPNLRHLSLEHPIPNLLLSEPHHLQFLSIPRPTESTWDLIVRLLSAMPNLCAVRARDVRWLRKGMNARAQEAGVQGTMREWRRRLARRGVRMLDAEWRDIE